MNKRLLSILLCLFLLFTFAVPAFAEKAEESEIQEEIELRQLSIYTVEDFLTFAENCRLDSFSKNLEVHLMEDLDLSDTTFSGIPIFCGVFRGRGHTITGVSITAEGSYQGLFRYITQGATVRDLTIKGTIQPEGSRNAVGAIAGSNAGTIDNCNFYGTVSGGDYIGGIAGRNTVTGMITYCNTEGEIHGDHFVGGITGENSGVIRNCTNRSLINTIPSQNQVALSDITMDTLTNSEAVNTVTDIGGISGLSSGVIRNCNNRGPVGYQLMGYNIGGIAGTQSGYITESDNYCQIQGRKEVGGIVGQMEPVTQIEFTEDILQILKGQLNTMSGLVSQASGNAQNNASQITGQIGVLQDQVETAKNAVQALLPSEGNTIPDSDALLAAQNTLSKTMETMPVAMQNIASAAQATVSGLSRDLSAISGQINAMGQTLNNGAEYIGGTVTDISDQDTPELLTGKVECCENYGDLLADLNVGGIAGAISMENDLDVVEDWQQLGDASLNFQSEIRAVILCCENSGEIIGKKRNIGGIVGLQSLGLVRESVNTGSVIASGADHVGGIAGSSTGFVRSNYAKCHLFGDTYIGGIAGSGTIVSNCLAHTQIEDATEKIGAIIGWQEDSLSDVETPVYENFYLQNEEDPGAIDGISYDGLAQPLALDAFLAIEGLPELFETVNVQFVFEDGSIHNVTVPVGEDLQTSQIPQIPDKEGHSASWGDLTQDKMADIHFDLCFEVSYDAYAKSIQSAQSAENGRPLLILEGSFTDAAVVSISSCDEVPVLVDQEKFLCSWSVSTNEGGNTARIFYPDLKENMEYSLYLRGNDGVWYQEACAVDGSYIVFAFEETDGDVALVEINPDYTVWIVIGAVIVLMLLIIVIIRVRKTRSKH